MLGVEAGGLSSQLMPYELAEADEAAAKRRLTSL